MPDSTPEEVFDTSEVGKKLIIALRSVVDPQAMMQAIADRAAVTLRAELIARIDAGEKAAALWHEDVTRVPTELQKSLVSLQELMEATIRASVAETRGIIGREVEHLQGGITHSSAIAEERFKAIAMQFKMTAEGATQLDTDNKTAIAAALQAQEKQALETQRTSQAAIAKNDASTTEAIKALTTQFNTSFINVEGRINDIKGRLDRGDGRSTVVDPEMSAALREINALRLANASGRGEKTGQSAAMGWIFAAIAAVYSLLATLILISRLITHI